MNDKIYLISTGEYSDYRPLYFAGTREEAEEFCLKFAQSNNEQDQQEIEYNGVFIEELPCCKNIEEYNKDKLVVEYKCIFKVKDNNIERSEITCDVGKYEFGTDNQRIKVEDRRNNPYLTTNAIVIIKENKYVEDKEKLWKIAQDYLYQYLYQTK